MDNIFVYSQMLILYIFNLFPLIAYFLIHKKFKTLWTSIMFYFSLLAMILDSIRDYFMDTEWKTVNTGEVFTQLQPSMSYVYMSYVSGFLLSISVVGLLLFAIDLHRKK